MNDAIIYRTTHKENSGQYYEHDPTILSFARILALERGHGKF